MDARSRYLHLLRLVLTRYLTGDDLAIAHPRRNDRRGQRMWERLQRHLGDDVVLARRQDFDPEKRQVGLELWPASAETMIGLRRLENFGDCIARALADDIPGDVIETGVWRGGAVIYAKAVLEAHDASDRTVWVADSFQGVPPPDPDAYSADAGDTHWTVEELAVTSEDVRRNFERYGLLDDRVQFLEGWFRDTLPEAPIRALAVMRLDGDLYQSTIEALDALYPRLSPGGYVIVDDYGAVEGCRMAVHDFREREGVTEPLETIDWTGVYWRRER